MPWLIETYLEENYILPKDTLEFNIEKWSPGNPLYIAGSSGDGKTTLAYNMAKDHNALIVSTDTLLTRLGWTKERWEQKGNKISAHNPNGIADIVSMDYINSHKNLPYNIGGIDPKTGKHKWATLSSQSKYFEDFFNWVELNAKTKYDDEYIIVEGSSIMIIDPEFFVGKPLIIIGGSNLRNLINRAKRNTYHEDERNIIVNVLKELKKYNSSYSHIDKNKWEFYDNMKNISMLS